MKKIMTIVGARPQFIKAGIVSKMLRNSYEEVIVHTGQHYDKNMSDIFFNEMDIPKPNYNLGIGSGSHAQQTAKMISELEHVIVKENPDGVLLFGDTNSTLAAAIVAAKLLIPIFHVEAGVRTGIFDMPEEQNRIVTDHLSSICFAATIDDYDNLKKENLKDKSIVCGDVMYDALLFYSKKIDFEKGDYKLNPLFHSKFIDIKKGYILATSHRPENTDDKKNLMEILKALNEMRYPVIFAVHPRIKNIVKESYLEFQNIYFVEPLSYYETLYYTKMAKFIVTDSGGLHKEAYLHGVPCTTILRGGWQQTVNGNWNEFVRPIKKDIIQSVEKRIIDKGVKRCQFGDGNSCAKILEEINKFFYEVK